ncbi:MAG TPA: transposase [Bacillota bacterium]|nr:transposase [Candidatus Glassbacteria bacterium]HUW43467.1 transposase [Bacillota bacterium]
MKKNYKYRIFPTKKQEKLLLATLEECRWTYNKILETRIKVYESEKKTLNKYATNNLMTEWKKERESLNDIHSQVLQNIAERVDLSFQGFFRRCKIQGEKCGFPRFKQYGRYDSFTFPQSGFSILEEKEPRLKLSKIGCIKIKLHRVLPEIVKRLTIQKTQSGKWYATFSCVIADVKRINTNPAVGIDLGLKEFAVLSNGEKIKRERFFKEEQKNLEKAQRKFSKITDKKSPERKKQRIIVAKIHERITNKRFNFTHQKSRQLVNQYGIICLEKLNIKSMQEKETIVVNGKEVKATGTHRSICDVAWNQFVNQLSYKAEDAGGLIIFVNPKDTTKMCSVCGKLTSKELSDRIHECSWCGLIMDRDLNASKNILRIGMDSLRNVKVPIEAPTPLG